MGFASAVENDFLNNRGRSLVWWRQRAAVGLLAFPAILLLVVAMAQPLLAQGASAAPDDPNNFGQYVVDHQDDLGPFFSKNAGDFLKLAVPVLLGVAGWVIIITMLVGWGLDVLLGRGFAFFYAPAFADWKRALIFATGRLFLSFIYTALMGLAVVVLLGFAHAGPIIVLSILVLGLVDLAAQIVWVLYLFRTDFGISIVFYIAVVVVHGIAATLVAQPIVNARATPEMTNFVDNAVTPRLRAEVQATRQQLTDVTSGRDSAQAKVSDCQNQLALAESEQGQLSREIEQKKNSDIYIFSQIVKARARGELQTARDEFAEFPGKFPGSPLDAQARAQLAAVIDQIGVAEAQRKQADAEAARAAAAARADLLARAARGAVTLSEMRQALVGKSRAQVSDLFGPPSDTASNQWSYRQQMIVNPLTSEHTGLTIYFSEGLVQGVDYSRGNE